MLISSKTKTPWFHTFFYIIWCILWTIGGFITLFNIIQKTSFLLTLWFILWLLAEYVVICLIHWFLFGIEIIKIENEEFYFTRNGVYRTKSIKANLKEFEGLDIIDAFGNLHEIEDTGNNLRFYISNREYCTLNKFKRQDIESLIDVLKNKK